MSLTLDLDDLSALKSRPGPKCSVVKLLSNLEEDARAKLKARMDDPEVEATKLAELLTRHGHAISADTIRRHRKRGTGNGCSCTA